MSGIRTNQQIGRDGAARYERHSVTATCAEYTDCPLADVRLTITRPRIQTELPGPESTPNVSWSPVDIQAEERFSVLARMIRAPCAHV